jgi:hypothetical protein
VKTAPELSSVDLETLESHWRAKKSLIRDRQIRKKLDEFLGQ